MIQLAELRESRRERGTEMTHYGRTIPTVLGAVAVLLCGTPPAVGIDQPDPAAQKLLESYGVYVSPFTHQRGVTHGQVTDRVDPGKLSELAKKLDEVGKPVSLDMTIWT